MGTLLGAVVIGKAQKLVQDQTGVRWPADEMLGWLNSGQRQIVLVRPDAGSATVLHQLGAGSKQALPVGGIRLLNVIRNMGIDGSTPGGAITFVMRTILDTQQRNWHFENPSATVKHFTYDDIEPRTWYCYPPQPSDSGRGQVHLVTSVSPAPVTMDGVKNEDGSTGSVNSVITLDDVYENPLIDYCVYRAHLKDAEFANNAKAQMAYGTFLQSLGLKSASDKAFSAQNNAPPVVNRNAPAVPTAFGS